MKKKLTGAKRRAVSGKDHGSAPPASATASPTITVGHLGSIGVHMQAVALRELHYREVEALPKPPGTLTELGGARQQPVSLQLEGRLNLHRPADSSAPLVELLLTATVLPEPSLKPIEIVATLGALFKASDSVGSDALLRFVNEAGVRILFPYLRELISAASGRGIYGPLFLDPVLVGPLVSEHRLSQVLSTG
jgi:preprotein translocase subunit SecB